MKNIPKIPLIIGSIFALALAVIIITTIALKKELPLEEARLEGKFKDRAGATFVGSEACKKCHERTSLEWKTSLHSRMMQNAKAYPEANIGDFEIASDVRKFDKKEVDYTLGSQWKQQYLEKKGRDLMVFPAQYNVPTGKWKAYFPDDPTKRAWFQECAGCHATGVSPEKKSFVEMGIGCESCHGPGSNHVEAVPGFEIPTIIQAGRLTPAAAAQICGSCHTRGRDKSGNYAYPVQYQRVRGVANLRLYFDEAGSATTPEYFWPSGESKYSNQQYLDWKQSQHAKVGVVCVTCHGVHKSRSKMTFTGEFAGLPDVTTARTRLFGDQLCANCHTAPQYRSVHRIHTFGSCVACHMPMVATIGEAGDARSHTFRFISPEASLKEGGLDKQPNSCSSCHHHKDTPLQDLAAFLEAAKKADMPKPFTVHATQREVRR
ncbi:MAG: hypothetical protein ISS63_01930 [Desulfobacteraceae bacterium]|nr:hypothetical protein [Desulfobacteraceae bacterium]